MTRGKLFLTCLALFVSYPLLAQKVTPGSTVYNEFRPATIFLTDGRKLNVPLANIFLKNSSLLYKSGLETKEARLNNVLRVDFKDRSYFKIDSLLAYRVDTVGNNALYRAERIDIEAYHQTLANNTDFTSIDFGDQISYTTAEESRPQDIHFPIMSVFYYRLDGKYVRVHERNLKKILSKEKRRLMESVISLKDFSWNDEQSLLKLLRVIQ